MAEYIEKKKLVNHLKMWLMDLENDMDKGDYGELCENKGAREAVESCICEVEEQPAADVQPIKHGRWEYYKNNGIFDTHKCTLCGEKYEMYMDIEPTTIYKYCPNCGARMDGDTND